MMFIFLLLTPLLCGINGTEIEPAETFCTRGACFTFNLQQKTFEEAQRSCQDNGGNLAVITDRTEAAEIQSALLKIKKKLPETALKFWIGLKLQKGSCTNVADDLRGFAWISGGTDATYTNWDREPISTCTEDRCAAVAHVLHPLETGYVKWADRSCKESSGFACKFNFKGMCKTLQLSNPGELTYRAPFHLTSISGVHSFIMLPYGTVATISCNGLTTYAVCKEMGDLFAWSPPCHCCDNKKRNCTNKNGGCEHQCVHDDNGEVRCECKEGYTLAVDKTTCVQTDYCKDSLCKFNCVSKHRGYTCTCPPGFQLAADQINCVDIDECTSKWHTCDHLCVNTNGSYRCACKSGYEMIDGKCRDIDECRENRCPELCFNSQGSFVCQCREGFGVTENGLRCVDIDECLRNPCEHVCINSYGSYKCSCKENFKLAADGTRCIPDFIPTEKFVKNNDENSGNAFTPTYPKDAFTQTMSSAATTNVTTENTYGYTRDSILYLPTVKATASNRSFLNVIFSNTWMLVCVLSSVVAILVIIVASVVVSCRFRHRKKDKNKKKSVTADNYCWVSSECQITPNKPVGHNQGT